MINEKLLKECIVETGKSGDWTYRKYKSGVAECWCTKQITANFPSNKAWGAFFESSERVDAFNFPTGLFKSIPALQISPSAVSGMAISGYETSANITKDLTPRVYVLRPVSTTETGTFNINYYALGNWK